MVWLHIHQQPPLAKSGSTLTLGQLTELQNHLDMQDKQKSPALGAGLLTSIQLNQFERSTAPMSLPAPEVVRTLPDMVARSY